MAKQTRPKWRFSRAPGNRAQDVITSSQPPATTQGLTTQSNKASHLKATTPNNMASPVHVSSYGQANGVQHSPGALEGSSQGPGIPDPPGHNGRKPGSHMGLLTRLKKQMKDDEDDTVKAVLEDLREPIRKSIQERSQKRLWTFLEQHGEEVVQSLREEQAPFVRAELRRELEPEIRAQVEAEFAGQREQKLAELAELDAEIERRRRSTAPPVAIKIEQEDQPSSPVRIKTEPNDEPLGLFLDSDDLGHQNVESRGNDPEIKQEDAGHLGTKDDSVIPWPFNFHDHDEPVDLPEEPVRSIHRDRSDCPENSLAMESDVDYSEGESEAWVRSYEDPEYTIRDEMREWRSCMSLPSKTGASEMEILDRLLEHEWSSQGSQTDHTDTVRDYFGSEPEFGNLDESPDHSRHDDDTYNDQEHVGRDAVFRESGESSNHSRQEVDTYSVQEDNSTSSLGLPIKTDSLYVADDADHERPPIKTRQSNAARGNKRKGETVFDDAADDCIENRQIKRAKINDTGLFVSKADRDISCLNIDGSAGSRADMSATLGDHDCHKNSEDVTDTEILLVVGNEKKVNETQRAVSSRKVDAVKTGRVKKSMPKKTSRRNLRCTPEVTTNYEEEEEEEEL